MSMQVLLRGSVLQRARLISGLVLFAFALAHFLNHAIGDTPEEFRAYILAEEKKWAEVVRISGARIE